MVENREQISGRGNPKDIHLPILEEIPEVLKIGLGVNIATTEFKCNHIDGISLKHLFCTGECIQLMALDINLQKANAIDIVFATIVVDGADLYLFGEREVDSNMIQTSFRH